MNNAPVNTTMKTLAKVFIIIGMVCTFYLIVPLIVGFIVLKKMKTAKPSTAMCVVTLLFCNMLGGIFLLLSKDEEYAPVAVPAPEAAPVDQNPQA